MDWKALAAKIASFSLPILSGVIGGAIEEVPILGSLVDGPELIQSVGRKAIAAAFGVEETPEAINAAIEGKPTTEVLTTLQGVQTGLVNKWPELATMVTALAKEETAQVGIAAEDRKDARVAAGRWAENNNPLATQQRRLGAAFIIGYFVLMGFMLYRSVPESQAFLVMLGVMTAGVNAILQFYFGSSAGSMAKDATIKQITEAAVPPPAPVVVQAPVVAKKK